MLESISKLMLLLCAFCLFGCEQNQQPEDKGESVRPTNDIQDYLEETYAGQFDWKLQDGIRRVSSDAVEAETPYYEHLQSIDINLYPYRGDHLIYYTFDLNPTCKKDGKEYTYFISIIRNEKDTEFIGAYMGMRNAEGGGSPIQSVENFFKEMKCENDVK
ncbi:hypothetical protein [Paenisporosarcina cavernae]|uniref:DUF4830 domain-containing protein n=1 Tax=Paenisporosarcina cavernae TaxID=2320858 RepID=A0A385YV34_9BACL|nr:hypothetical protein [Paenisporosarcina cavernae]AYC30140.1 hypothetical protein D3873_09740 [Paenisporosarcina cavernae]